MFDLWIRQPKVARSEYDTVYRWYEEKRDELNAIREALLKFASIGSSVGSEAETTLQLAKNARALLDSDTRVIKALERDNANLVEQLEDIERLRADAFKAYDEQVEKNTGLRREIERLEKLLIDNPVPAIAELPEEKPATRKRSTKKPSA